MVSLCVETSRFGGDIMNIVLGLDMSSHKSGYALFVNGKLDDYGCWEIDNDTEPDWRKRIAYMADCVAQYCKANYVQHIYVEDVPPTIENSQTVKVLSALQGMVIAIGVSQDINVEFIPVKTWKQKIGINLTSSKANSDCKKKIKELRPKSKTKDLNKVKSWVKAQEKKMSVDYVNNLFNINLVYKSPSSKFNDDDISDAINIAWSQIGNVKAYDLESFEDIMNRFYDLLE